jgi:hypothetical protein
MRMLDVPQRGKRGRIVASRNRFGAYQKALVPPDQPGTPAQQAVWDTMTELSALWNELSGERRLAWDRFAVKVQSRRSLGQSGPLDGIHLFKKLNSVLRTCGRELLSDPPPLPAFAPNPVIGFAITERRDRLVLQLKLYLKKLAQWRKLKPRKYHLPLEGSRIFIRVWQQANGWEHRLGMFQANDLAPLAPWLQAPWKSREK